MSALAEQAHAALADIVRVTTARRLLVAYSGGRDSSALLHLARAFAADHGLELGAVHVDHGLAAASAQWAAHCRARAAALGVACTVVRLEQVPPRGASIEAWAREARYAVLARHCGVGTVVLTAHHRDDQVETVLQRVLRGAGPHGLAGIPRLRALGAGHLGRPLLGCARGAIEAYLRAHGLDWVDDPANVDARFLRNRLRQRLLPLLEAEQPGVGAALLRLAAIQAEVALGLDRLADGILARAGLPCDQIALASLAAAGGELAPYVLRRALVRAGCARPGARQLREILTRLCTARGDAVPVVRWGGHAVRRYRGRLYVTAAELPAAPPDALPWQTEAPLVLPWGTLRGRPGTTRDALDPARLAGARVTVAFRAGGERCQPAGRAHRHALKKLFQAWGVPPWERALTPLVYVDGVLAAVAGQCVCAPFAAAPGSAGLGLDWQRHRERAAEPP